MGTMPENEVIYIIENPFEEFKKHQADEFDKFVEKSDVENIKRNAYLEHYRNLSRFSESINDKSKVLEEALVKLSLI